MRPQRKQQRQPQPATANAATLVNAGNGKPAAASENATELDRQKTIGARLATRFAEALRALA